MPPPATNTGVARGFAAPLMTNERVGAVETTAPRASHRAVETVTGPPSGYVDAIGRALGAVGSKMGIGVT